MEWRDRDVYELLHSIWDQNVGKLQPQPVEDRDVEYPGNWVKTETS